MKKITLASASPQREILLRQLKINFKVARPKIQEKRISRKLTCAELVKHNAILKARDVARRVKKGLIIAADTAVLSQGKIIGKPKNKRQALTILRHLSRHPHLVYTGLAVLDAGSKKIFSDCERTKVYMHKMNDEEIKRYINKVYTLNKAGSFDIQGWGALFIRRIEGCFYNVVGLPLAKLNCLLKKFGVHIICLALAVIFSGCEYNLATQREEMILYSSDKEVAMGRNIAREVEKEFEVSQDLKMQERVDDVGQKIAGVCDRKDILYYFKVIKDPKEEDLVNAFALPGGYVFVFEELMKISSDDELACVLSHEIGHIAARHSIKKLQAAMGYMLLRLATMNTDVSQLGSSPDIAFDQIMLGYSREDELLSDKLGIEYAKEAGFDPSGMLTFFDKLKQIEKKKPPRPLSYERTHPYMVDRVRLIKQKLYGRIDFMDYYNKNTE